MVIRKEFRVESAHIVRNCTSERCSHSVHGHSAVIEVFFESKQLDNAQMVVDFGLMKSSIKEFIDSMDHCTLICKFDDPEYIRFVKKFSDRWIEMPFNPSAEMLSIYLFKGIQDILNKTTFRNGEDANVKVKAVRYHETVTGYAEASQEDVNNIWKDTYKVEYSPGVVNDWGIDLQRMMETGERIINPVIKQQIKLG